MTHLARREEKTRYLLAWKCNSEEWREQERAGARTQAFFPSLFFPFTFHFPTQRSSPALPPSALVSSPKWRPPKVSRRCLLVLRGRDWREASSTNLDDAPGKSKTSRKAIIHERGPSKSIPSSARCLSFPLSSRPVACARFLWCSLAGAQKGAQNREWNRAQQEQEREGERRSFDRQAAAAKGPFRRRLFRPSSSLFLSCSIMLSVRVALDDLPCLLSLMNRISALGEQGEGEIRDDDYFVSAIEAAAAAVAARASLSASSLPFLVSLEAFSLSPPCLCGAGIVSLPSEQSKGLSLGGPQRKRAREKRLQASKRSIAAAAAEKSPPQAAGASFCSFLDSIRISSN